MDIFWRDNLECPSEEDYKQMISDSRCSFYCEFVETGGLLRLSIGLMQAFSSNKTDYSHLLVSSIAVQLIHSI